MTALSSLDSSVLQWHIGELGVFEKLASFIHLKGSSEVPNWCVIRHNGNALCVNSTGVVRPSADDFTAMTQQWQWYALKEGGWFGVVGHSLQAAMTLKAVIDTILCAPSSTDTPVVTLPITQALKRLHAITATSELTLSQKIDRILALGCELMQLPFGIVARVNRNSYRVEYCCSPSGELTPGAEFDLGNCYCVHTLERDQVTGFFHAGQSEIAAHPCYEVFQLEAYLGVSIRVQGEVWGTLNFSSPTPRMVDFSDDEYEIVKLFGQWIGEELTRERNALVLQKAEQQHRLILGSVHDGVLGLNERCVITFANASAASITGYDIDQLVGMSIERLLAGDALSVASESCPIMQSLNHGETLSAIESEFYDCANRPFSVKYVCTPIQDELNEQVGVVLTFQDITDQVQAEAALQQQIKLFRSLFEDAPEGIVVVDRDRKIVMANPYFVGLFGYQESDLIGRTAQCLYANEAEFNEVGMAFANDGSPDYHEYRMLYRRMDGTTFVAENVRSKVLDDQGRFNGYIVHCRDITSRLKIEEDIEKARNRLSIATQSGGIGVWEMGIASDTLLWDDLMHQLYGVSPGTVTRREHWDALIHEEDLRRVQASAEKAIAEHGDLDVDFRIVRPDGRIRYIKANARVAVDSNGDAAYLFGVNFDITERYETETILKNAREEAVRANRAKSNFLATMSHEIRTPLNGVLGMAEILASTDLTERQMGQLDIIRSSGESLLELINEILDFSKIEAGHLSLEMIDFDLERLVFELSRLLVVKAESKGIDLLVHYDLPISSLLQGDAYRIRQVLMNLVGNAIKFTEQGHVIIKVEGVACQNSDAVNLTICVEDTGIGIAPDKQGQLFHAFTQADNSTTRQFGGTGLGLAITKQLVELMGGEIWFESSPNQGSTFSFTLSLERATNAPHKNVDVEAFDFERILVVDDNATNLSIIEHQLSQFGLQADYEQSATAAVERVIRAEKSDAGAYDLLVLDYLMPELDGLSVNRAVRSALPEECWPKALMMSSAGILATEQLREAGIKVCINKPSSLDELRAGLSEAMCSQAHAITVTTKNGNIEKAHYQEAKLDDAVILVVEDMKANLAVVKGMLAQQGGRVEVAENGLEGVKKWRSLQPDLILMDLHMPVMDGITAIKEIRQLEQGTGRRVPILALTADVQSERVAEVEAIGGDGYISKPFKRQELLDAISHWLGKTEQASSNTMQTESETESMLSSSDSLDPSVLDGLEELLGSQVREIVMAFVEDADAVFSDMDQALKDGAEAEHFYRPAHSLKSISANVGALALNALAATLEEQAKTGQLLSAEAQVAELKREYVHVKDILRQTGRLA